MGPGLMDDLADAVSLISIPLILVFIFCLPMVLTALNIIHLFLHDAQTKMADSIDSMLFTIGPIMTWILYAIWDAPYWEEALYLPLSGGILETDFHEPFSREYFAMFIVFSVVGWGGFMLLRFVKKLPPLFAVLCLSGVYIGCIFCIFWIVQIMPYGFDHAVIFPIEGLCMCLFPFNYLISSTRLIKILIMRERQLEEGQRKPVLSGIGRMLLDSRKWPLFAFAAMLPVLGICMMILILFGQQPGDLAKLFTDTSDWFLSKQLSPPAVYYDDHYLCTVAAGGHRKLVKPQRFGRRHGHQIIVNRQLCIANAFEELIAEKTPGFHKRLRHFYDTYGYPIARHIKNPWTADFVYLLMKPLEWFFLIILYLTDMEPEKRICRQYAA